MLNMRQSRCLPPIPIPLILNNRNQIERQTPTIPSLRIQHVPLACARGWGEKVGAAMLFDPRADLLPWNLAD